MGLVLFRTKVPVAQLDAASQNVQSPRRSFQPDLLTVIPQDFLYCFRRVNILGGPRMTWLLCEILGILLRQAEYYLREDHPERVDLATIIQSPASLVPKRLLQGSVKFLFKVRLRRLEDVRQVQAVAGRPARLAPFTRLCPLCRKSHDRRIQSMRHLPLFGRAQFLQAQRVRHPVEPDNPSIYAVGPIWSPVGRHVLERPELLLTITARRTGS